MFRAVIIDDEPAARRMMRELLRRHSAFVEITGEARNGEEAIRLVNTLCPDLIFLDIQMPGFSGFDVLQRLTHPPNVIFTTAYEEYALKAFETLSVDYLLKPIRQERLDAAIEKLKAFGKTVDPPQETLQKLQEQYGQRRSTALSVKLGDRILLFRYDAVSHFEADDKYVWLFTGDGKKYLTDQTLSALAQKLPQNFLRVQKSYIVNTEKIREIQKHFNGRFVFVMEDAAQTRILSGLTFYEKIKEAFGL